MRNILISVVFFVILVAPVRGQIANKSGVTASAISLPSGAGSIEGLGESFEPQLNTGGSTYGVSIALPPGRAGLAPSVRLGYSSFGGNGICGIGWSLGLPSIKRQTDKGFPEYNRGDTFVFEGEELVPLTNAEQDWRCENERNFQRFRQLDTDFNGFPDAWEVTERNGTKHTFGKYRGQNDRWSVVDHPEKEFMTPFDRTYCWMIDTTVDLHGNRIEYEYVQGSGVLYASRISYSHLGDNAQEIHFQYEARPDAFDDYRPTFSALLDRRLRRIEVRSQGQLVRAYNFAYAYEPGDLTPDVAAIHSTYLDLGVTLLKRIVQVDRSGDDANFLPPLIFTYSGLDLAQAEERSFVSPPELDLAEPNGRVQLADVDGDALPDLLTTSVDGGATAQRVCLNRGETLASGKRQLEYAPSRLVLSSSQVDLAQPNVLIHDPKGKGLVDLSCLVDDGFNKRLDTFGNRSRLDVVNEERLGFGLENVEVTVLQNPPSFVTYSQAATRQMDVNFDKRGDFVNLEPSFGAMIVNSFFIQRDGTWAPNQTTLPPSYPLANTFAGPNGEPNPCVHLADMNGDRMLDLVCLDPLPSAGGQTITVSYWPLCGLGRYADQRDVITSTSDTFDIGTVDLRDVFLDDFTGDGLADILILDSSEGETVLTLRVNIAGKGWSPPYMRGELPRYAPRAPANPTILRMADLNANGSVDLLFRNTLPQDDWTYIELLPAGQPSLLTGIDNSIGKRTAIVYGTAAEDEQRAHVAGHPWRTFAPIPLQVVRTIRTSCGLDLNGDGHEDVAVAEFRYRDPFYDGFEREFRGFGFAQRVDYGDDFLFDEVTGLMDVSSGWDPASTPTGQVSGPSLVTRFRYHTGASDQRDNDDYGDSVPPIRIIDEVTEVSGREEEALKGLQLVEEKIDPVVLHSVADGGFDEGCEAAATADTAEGQGRITPDAYVYTRIQQEWTVKRLYRPSEALPYLADMDADGILEDYRATPIPLIPAGRFADQNIAVVAGNGRSVSFVFVKGSITELHEANELLSTALGYPEHPPLQTRQSFDYDDYGNQTHLRDFGVDGGDYDDERFSISTFAHGGNALSLWVIDRPDTISITDENNVFVARKVYFYDGEPFVGVQGQIQDRALPSRTLEHIDADRTIQASRTRFDAHGNIEETRDPVGNRRVNGWDSVFQSYPTTETIVVGGGSPDLKIEAEYDFGFGVVTRSVDFNGNITRYIYDSFGRLVKSVRPGDSIQRPTTTFEYQPADPIRGRGFSYDATGNLTVNAVSPGSASWVASRQREIAGEDGEYITVSYTDGYNRALASVEEGEVLGTWVATEASSYNLRSTRQSAWLPFQISSAEIPQFPAIWPAGRPPASDGITPLVVSTDYCFDPLGRQIQSKLPPEDWDGPRRNTAAQHLPLQKHLFDEEDLNTVSPHAGTPHLEFTDGLGRLNAIEEAVMLTDTGLSGPLTHWRTHYAYDLNDKLIEIKDSQGNIKTMVYDGLTRMTMVEDPDRGSTVIIYDDASNVLETLDAKGQRSVFTYDGVNRIKTEDYQDGGDIIFDVEYFYDLPQIGLDIGDGTTATANNTKGELAYIRDQSGETHFSYDVRARSEWEVKRILDPLSDEPVSYRTGYAYDSADRLTILTYPDGDELQHDYNLRNLTERIYRSATGDLISSISYAPSGQLGVREYGNGDVTSYAYDPRLRLKTLQTVNQSSERLVDFNYTFDGVSNVKRIDDRRNLQGQSQAPERFNTQVFAYDNLYRITEAKYPTLAAGADRDVNYLYDRIGNMVLQTSNIAQRSSHGSVTDMGTMAYGGTAGPADRFGRKPSDPPGPHALTAVTSLSPANESIRLYPYDANGNMIEIDGKVCTWDFKDRLVSVEDDGMRALYTYDYSDRRITKQVHWKNPSLDKGAQPSDLNPEWRITSVQYINRYFEVREHDAWVKYVWNGQTRVARLTKALGGDIQVQHVRLEMGWNPVTLRVGGQFSALDPAGNIDILAAAFWSGATQDGGWTAVTATTPLPAQSVLWIYASRETSVALRGEPSSETWPELTGSGQFVQNLFSEPIDLAGLLPEDSWVARFDTLANKWRHRLPANGLMDASSDGQTVLLPGRWAWTTGGSAGPIGAGLATLKIRYYHQDHLGSASVITDANGALVEETAFYPFGYPRNEYRPRQLDEPFKFTQKEQDRESGLHYFEARYLAGGLSRFISIDPKYAYPGYLPENELSSFLTEPQDINLYAYARNNPLRYTDATGLGVWDSIKDAAQFVKDNAFIPIYHDRSQLDVGKTARVSVGIVTTTVAGSACIGGVLLACPAAVLGADNVQSEYSGHDISQKALELAPFIDKDNSRAIASGLDIVSSVGGGYAAAKGSGAFVGGVQSIGQEVLSSYTHAIADDSSGSPSASSLASGPDAENWNNQEGVCYGPDL